MVGVCVCVCVYDITSVMNRNDKDTASGDQLSVVNLSRLHERVLRLREHLRAALLADGPQLEMIVFTSLFDLYQNFYFALFCARAAVPCAAVPTAVANADQPSLVSSETRFVTSAYTQDLLAACVYLLDVDELPTMHVVSRHPPPLDAAHNDDNASTAYVSKAQRDFCFSIFMYVCWSDTSLPLRDVLHALYPLLDPGLSESSSHNTRKEGGAPAAADCTMITTSASSENSIAVDLFSQPRFASRKRLIGEMLSGLVLSRANGLRALLRVLLLDDRIEADMTAEAAQLLVRLLTTPPSAVWVLSEGFSGVASENGVADTTFGPGNADSAERNSKLCVLRDVALSVESQLKLLAPQLLSLLEEQVDGEADEGKDKRNLHESAARARQAANAPRFLARLEAQHQRLPPETVEQRLHLFLTLLLNNLVHLPPRHSADFPRSYRQFFYTNKYLLSPGFGCLSLRGDGPFSAADVTSALRRLTSLVKGVALGAGMGVLSHVLPATAAGVLNLCALQPSVVAGVDGSTRTVKVHESPVTHALHKFLEAVLSNPSLYELAAHAFVRACTANHDRAFSRGSAVEHNLTYETETGTSAMLTRGLTWLLSALPMPAPDFVHACVEAMADACQLSLYAAGIETLATSTTSATTITSGTTNHPIDGEGGEDERMRDTSPPPLVLLLEHLCLSASSEAIFGTRGQLSLDSTLALLNRLLGLSVVLFRWALGMVDALMKSDSVRVALLNDEIAVAPVAGTWSTYDIGDAATEEHRRALSRFVRTCEDILATLQLLSNVSNQHNDGGNGGACGGNSGTAVVASLITDDAELLTLAADVCRTLNSRMSDAARLLSEWSTARGGASSVAEEGGCSHSSETAMMATALWQRRLTQLQSALDGRASVDVAMTLAALSRSVDEVVHDVADPQPLRSVMQPFLLTLARVLYECDDVGSAVRAVHCLTWLSMYRFDSADSSFIADVVWAVIGEATLPAWLATHAGHISGKAPALAARVHRFRVRLLDVLLALTDYDADGRTLRNIDDALRRTRDVALFDVLVRLCHNTSDALLQVATLHLVGAYAVAVHPRVPLAALCDLCRDVFRLSPHAMAKAACAAALGTVVAALCESADATALLLTEVDLETCQGLASAMASYRSRAPASSASPSLHPASYKTPSSAAASVTTEESSAEVSMHDAVIQQHGRDMLRLLRRVSQSCSASTPAQTPSVLQVELPPAGFH